MPKVMIDPGHGPKCANGGKNGYKEYAGMWKASNCLKSALVRCGIQAELTRAENEDPTLEARGSKAAGYDIFISEHSNAGGGKGVECYFSVKKMLDKEKAAVLSDAVAKVMNTPNRGAKMLQGTNGLDYYGVLRAAASTNVKHIFLIENGFHDNLQDEAFLLVDGNLIKIAEAQAQVICSFLGVKYVLEIKEEIEMRYNKLSEMPPYARDTIRKMISKGFLSGSGTVKDENGLPADLDLSLDMIRIFVINDRIGVYGV